MGGDDPFVPIKSLELSNPETWRENWVHHPMYTSILSKIGRCVHPVLKLEDDQDMPEGEPEPEEGEPPNKPLTEEEEIIAGTPAFSVRLTTPILGDYSPAVLRSNRWPGAHTVVLEAEVVNVYVGDGVKYTGQPFQIAMPPEIPEECSDTIQEGDEDPVPRKGMREETDVPMPDSFNTVDDTPDDGQGDQDS